MIPKILYNHASLQNYKTPQNYLATWSLKQLYSWKKRICKKGPFYLFHIWLILSAGPETKLGKGMGTTVDYCLMI